MRVTAPSQPIRFGVFEVDLHTQELRKQGLKLKLTGQPFDVLAMLLEHPGELVTREEFEKQLWSGDTFVDFEHGLNTAVKKLREALGDSADNPRFVETLARRGYRFIAPVESHAPLTTSSAGRGVSAESPERRGIEANSPPDSGGGQGVVAVGAHGVRPDVGALGTRRVLLRRLAVGGAALLAIILLLFALNVGGLRDWVLTTVGAHGVRPGVGAMGTRRVPLPIESIAVLPLENLSSDPEQEYFADGMTDELITELGQIGSLRVISRTSVMRYKQTKKPLPEIAKELNVQAIVEGSVLRSENWVRITVNLIDAKSDRHLWAHSYESEHRDVLKLQSQLAHDIAQQIQVSLRPQEKTRLTRARPVNPEAHEAYLMGLYHWYKWGPGEFPNRTSMEYFQKATFIDPAYAPPYTGLARGYIELGYNGALAPTEAFPKAKAAANKALALDDELAEAHAAMGAVKYSFEWDWTGAEREIKRAIELNPSSYIAHEHYAQYLTLIGHFDEAIKERQRAFELDPSSRFWFGWTYVFAGRYDQAITEFKEIVNQGVIPEAGHIWLSILYSEKGMTSQAIAECETAKTMTSIPAVTALCGSVYALAGKRREAQKEFDAYLRRPNPDAWMVAGLYSAMGDKDRTFEWLMKAYEQRSANLCLLKVAPDFARLRSDPRFQDLLRRMNFPP